MPRVVLTLSIIAVLALINGSTPEDRLDTVREVFEAGFPSALIRS